MSRPLACLMSSLMLATALPAAAQTPSGLGDLVGTRAGQAEGELTVAAISLPIGPKSWATGA